MSQKKSLYVVKVEKKVSYVSQKKSLYVVKVIGNSCAPLAKSEIAMSMMGGFHDSPVVRLVGDASHFLLGEYFVVDRACLQAAGHKSSVPRN